MEFTRAKGLTGDIVGQSVDVDRDGRADLIWDLSGTVRTFRQDLNHDGIPEHAEDVVDTRKMQPGPAGAPTGVASGSQTGTCKLDAI